MKEIKRHTYGTARGAASFFQDALAQGYSPSVLVTAKGFEVVVYGEV